MIKGILIAPLENGNVEIGKDELKQLLRYVRNSHIDAALHFRSAKPNPGQSHDSIIADFERELKIIDGALEKL
jgi:hypothetical protein